MTTHNESTSEQKSGSFSIRRTVEFESFVKDFLFVGTNNGVTHHDLKIRICKALGLKELSKLELAPLDKAILVTEISEKYLSRFQCYLQTIHFKNGGGGNYQIDTGRVRVGVERVVSTFIHEVAHAIHYAIIGNTKVCKQFASELRRIRKDNLDYLKIVYIKAMEHEPRLKIRESFFNSIISDRIHFWVRELNKYSENIPQNILKEFAGNLASLYALKNSKEYFSEYMTDYLLNPEPSVFTRRVWQLTETMAADAHPKVIPVSNWIDRAEFSCRQGVVGKTSRDTLAWICRSNWSFVLPGIDDVILHQKLQEYIYANAPAVKTGCRPKPHLFYVPSDLGVSFKNLLLVPSLYAHWGFYHYALKTAGEIGLTSIDVPLFCDFDGTSFNDLLSDLKKTDQLLPTTTLHLRNVTFFAPDRFMALRLKKCLPVTLENIALDNTRLEVPVRLADVTYKFTLKRDKILLPIKQQPVIAPFTQWLAGVDVELKAERILNMRVDAAIVYVSQFSSLFTKQFGARTGRLVQHGRPDRVNVTEQMYQRLESSIEQSKIYVYEQLESIIEQAKMGIYRMGPGNVLSVEVPPDLELHLKHLILVPRSQQFRQATFLSALRMADELKVSELAVPYYMYAHEEKVALDFVDDLRYVDRELTCKPSFLRKISFCALAKNDFAPFLST